MSQDSELDVEEVVYSAQEANVNFVELPLHRKVFIGIGTATLFLGLIVTSRLFVLNIGKGEFYTARAIANVERQMNIPAARGAVIDRNGIMLVHSEAMFSVLLNVHEFFKKDTVARVETIKKLNVILASNQSNATIDELFEHIDFEKESAVIVRAGIDAQSATALRVLHDPAIVVRDDYRRVYPYHQIFAHVIGYTGESNKGAFIEGKTGIENQYNDDLRGHDGLLVTAHDVYGNVLETRIAAEATIGATVRTTLDARFQEYIYTRLQQGLAALGRDAGIAIALKPKTGEVLALVNIPSYDPNVFTLAGKSKERLKFLVSRKTPLFNRAISGRYSPGSTIKPLIGLAALHENIVNPTDEFFSSGVLELPNPYHPEHPSKFLDWKAHGYVNLYGALARSSNIYFYILGGGLKDIVGLGIARIKDYWDRLGFNAKTGIDLPGEAEGMLLNQTDWEERFERPWRVGNTYNTSIGQGDMLLTPLRLVTFINSIAANGAMYRPYITQDIMSIDGKIIKQYAPEALLNYGGEFQKEIHAVQRGLRDAVQESYGTAHSLNDLPMPVSGKTGSAQIQSNTKVNAFFVGYAPSEDPEIGLLILVEDAKEGSINTLPIAHDILEWYYEHRLQGKE